MTVLDLIQEASVMAGISSPTEVMPSNEANYGFSKLNQMVDEFASERLNIFREQRVGPFTVTSGQGNATVPSPITIGVGATWDTPRPSWIDRAGVIYTAGGTPRPEQKMHVFTTKEWSFIAVKGITSTLSTSLFYDRIFTSSGYGHIYLYPVPSASFQVVLYVPVAVAEFPYNDDGSPDFTTVISLPPGYRSMLVSNLAVIVSIGLFPVSEDLRERAVTSKSRVMASNVVTHMDALSCDEAVRNQDGRNTPFNWVTGDINT